MYKMIGGDGREYGPVAAEQIRVWMLEGRLNAQTLLQIDGTEGWRPAASFSEFQDLFSTTEEKDTLTDPPLPRDTCEPGPGKLSVLRCLAGGVDLLLKNFGLFCGASLLAWVMQMLLMSIPVIGGLLNMSFYGIIYGGLFMVFLKRLRGLPARVSDSLNGFHLGVAQLVLAGLFTQVLSSFGLLLFVLPGIYLIVAWTFALPLVADRGMEFWSAMEVSRKTVHRCWFRVAMVSVIAFLPVLAVLFYNYLRTVRETVALVSEGGINVERLQQVLEAANSRAMLQQVVLLFALPLGGGMIMQAYEDLFGASAGDKE